MCPGRYSLVVFVGLLMTSVLVTNNNIILRIERVIWKAPSSSAKGIVCRVWMMGACEAFLDGTCVNYRRVKNPFLQDNETLEV